MMNSALSTKTTTGFLTVLITLIAAEGGLGQSTVRAVPAPIHPEQHFQSAVERATRSITGVPGEAYWQQRADYRIAARLDVETARVTAKETVTYSNGSPDVLSSVLFHLDQNVYAPGARRNRRVPITGGMTIETLRIDGQAVDVPSHGGGYYAALTLLEVPLLQPLRSGETVEIEFEWSFTVPPAPTFRNGNLNFEVFSVAQWYPRVAVYDDVYGWDRTPYLGDGEFYLEYGDFEVSLTVPSGWLVGGTGLLQNPGDVLSEESARRLGSVLAHVAAAETVVTALGEVPVADLDRVVHVVDGTRETGTRAGQELTWRFRAENVRDFAWATSADYVWDAVATRVPEGDAALGQALYRPEFEAWREVARYAAHTLTTYSEWLGAYPYPQLTITEGPVGGMEYPMMVFNPGSNNPRGVAGVTIHEGGHQWFPMIVGSMEAKHSFMDEGFNSYFDELSAAVLWGEEAAPWGDNRQYLAWAGKEREVPLIRHTDLVNPYGERTLAAYRKPAVMLGALRQVLGDEVFFSAFRDYVVNWSYKHPQPMDFFNTVERIAGQDLDWFWRPWVYETAVLDHAVTDVVYAEGTSTILVADLGGIVLPVLVQVTKADGSVVDLEAPVSAWLAGERTQSVSVEGEVIRVEIDVRHVFPDIDRENNLWVP